MNWLFLFGIYLPIAIFYRASHKLTVKAEEVFWETRNKGFLNIAVFTSGCSLNNVESKSVWLHNH
jgi:hypothetical protein